MDQALLILSEECAEVIQAASKCQRFGWDGKHPVSGITNRANLEQELGDLLALVEILTLHGQLDMSRIEKAKYEKFKKLRIYSTLDLSLIKE